ncbi:MAG: KamA family radical SAM protein [Gemmatimonadetes bacterium]|nr:KamA family radical SAM protein [Gemmatimonadota bacterium]
MSNWQEILRESLVTVDDLVERFGAENVDRAAVEKAIDKFNLRITPAALAQIQKPGDAFWQQYVPTAAENEIVDGIVDSLDEDADSPVPNITHRYPDRVLFLVSPVCSTYCRFCTRRRKVGDPEKIPLNQFDAAFAYLREHTEIRDVILSGGDPFMLSDRRIEYFLSTLRAIPHLEIIRIHTRMPSHLPERITPELCDIVKRHHPVYINVHFNHPDELTPAAVKALGMLADSGAPLGSQTVLLKGVNDEPEIMKSLMHKLLMARVKPYYIYQADVVAGGEHFRTSVQKGLEIIQALRGWTSGLGVPHYVIDAPGGGGKIPILPEYVQSVTDSEVVLRNYAGEEFRYPLPQEKVAAGGGCDVPSIPARIAAREVKRSAGKKGGSGSGRKANGARAVANDRNGKRNGNGHGANGKSGGGKQNGPSGLVPMDL